MSYNLHTLPFPPSYPELGYLRYLPTLTDKFSLMAGGLNLLETCRRIDFELNDGVVHGNGSGSGSNSILNPGDTTACFLHSVSVWFWCKVGTVE